LLTNQIEPDVNNKVISMLQVSNTARTDGEKPAAKTVSIADHQHATVNQ
jgi:hypothetical protein